MVNKFSARLSAMWTCVSTLLLQGGLSRSRPRGRVSFSETEGLPHDPDHAIMDFRAKLRGLCEFLRTQTWFSGTTDEKRFGGSDVQSNGVLSRRFLLTWTNNRHKNLRLSTGMRWLNGKRNFRKKRIIPSFIDSHVIHMPTYDSKNDLAE